MNLNDYVCPEAPIHKLSGRLHGDVQDNRARELDP